MSNVVTIKFENHKIPEFKEVKNKEWVYFGEDNLYPEYLIELALRSAKHGAILAGKVNYIYGGGLHVVESGASLTAKANANKFIRQINSDGFLRKMIQDFEWFNGFFIEPIFNKSFTQLTSINYIPFSKIRVSPDESKYFYSNDWRASTKQDPEKTGYKEFDPFNLDKPGNNQLFYFKIISPKNGRDRNVYPVPEYIGACASIETDIEIANFHLNNIKTGFSAGTFFNFNNGVPTLEAQDAIEKQIKKKFQGTDRAGSVTLTFNASSDNAPTITNAQPNDLDKQFIEIGKRVEQDIFTGHKITSPMLFGVKTEGQLGGRSEMIDAFELFQNTYTDIRQKMIEEVLNEFARLQGVTGRLEIQRVQAVKKSIPDAVLQRVYEAYSVDQLVEEFGMPKIKRPTVPVAMCKHDDLYEVLFEREFKGESDEDAISTFKMQFAKELSVSERAIVDLLSKDSLMPSSDIAKILKIDTSEVNSLIDSLDSEGYLKGTEATKKGLTVIDNEGAKTENIEVKYKYVWRPGITPDDNVREKCAEWLKATANQSGWFSRDQIENLDNGEGLDVWDSKGGWWNKNGNNVPYCRHLWKQMVVRIK